MLLAALLYTWSHHWKSNCSPLLPSCAAAAAQGPRQRLAAARAPRPHAVGVQLALHLDRVGDAGAALAEALAAAGGAVSGPARRAAPPPAHRCHP